MRLVLSDQDLLDEGELTGELFALLVSHFNSVLAPLHDHRIERLALDVLWHIRPSTRQALRDHLLEGPVPPLDEMPPSSVTSLSDVERALLDAHPRAGPVFDLLVPHFARLLAPADELRRERWAMKVLWHTAGASLGDLERHLQALTDDS